MNVFLLIAYLSQSELSPASSIYFYILEVFLASHSTFLYGSMDQC